MFHTLAFPESSFRIRMGSLALFLCPCTRCTLYSIFSFTPCSRCRSGKVGLGFKEMYLSPLSYSSALVPFAHLALSVLPGKEAPNVGGGAGLQVDRQRGIGF